MARSGVAPHATAAGSAEAQAPLLVGTLVALLLAAVLSFRHGDGGTGPVLLAMLVAGLFFAADVALSHWMVNGPYGRAKYAAVLGAAAAAAIYTVVVVVAACRRGRSEGRSALPIAALAAAVLLAAVYTFTRYLEDIARTW